MRIFHVSEDENISVFEPRVPKRTDIEATPIVWAVSEERLTNYLVPRECPRVGFHIGAHTTDADADAYFSSSARHALIVESGWFEVMRKTTLWLYEFDPSGFYLQDEPAGYYVSESTQLPTAKLRVDDLFDELFRRGCELRFVDNLHPIAEKIKYTSLDWSLIRMRNALRTDGKFSL